jgi:hypothetical protein
MCHGSPKPPNEQIHHEVSSNMELPAGLAAVHTSSVLFAPPTSAHGAISGIAPLVFSVIFVLSVVQKVAR